MRPRRGIVLMSLVSLLLPLAGCWDRREVEELAYVLAIGVDRGRAAAYAMTAMIAIPAKMAVGGGENGGGGGGGEDKPYMLVTVEAPTLAGALAVMDSSINRRTTLIHTKAFLMGEDLAKLNGRRTMDELTRFRQVRRAIFYIVTKGRASAFLKEMKPEMEKDPNRFIEQMTYAYRYTGMIPHHSQIHNFVTQVDTRYAAPLTYYASIKDEEEAETQEAGGKKGEGGHFRAGSMPKKGGPNVEMIGGAAFSGDKMMGVLTGEEIRHVLMLQDAFRHGFISLKDPGRPDLYVSLEVSRGRPTQIQVDLSGDRPRIRALVKLEAEILSIQSEIDYTEPVKQGDLEIALSRDMVESMRSMLKKTQSWNADVVGFGRHVVKQFPTVQAWEAYDWPALYRDAEIDVDVRVTLRRFGLQMSPPATRERRESR